MSHLAMSALYPPRPRRPWDARPKREAPCTPCTPCTVNRQRVEKVSVRSSADCIECLSTSFRRWHRLEYQRDRDRVIHTRAFRRLKHKTQVFVAPDSDHVVTRMPHTIEVQQVARSIARALGLNEDLTEAIALGHDLGYTPFGHAGETALGELLPDGFRHNEQSLRIVDHLEAGGRGLNLTHETREGILMHSKTRESVAAEAWGTASTLEGQIVKLADSIAYLNHDFQDAIRAGVLVESELPAEVARTLGAEHSRRTDTLVRDCVLASWSGAHSEASGTARITLSPRVLAATDVFRDFIFERVYLAEPTLAGARAGQAVVRGLYRHYASHAACTASRGTVRLSRAPANTPRYSVTFRT